MSSWSQAGCHPSAACSALLPKPARLLPSQPGRPAMCVHCQTAITRTHRMRCPPPLGRQCRSCTARCWCCLRCWMRRPGRTGRRHPSSRCWQGTLQSQCRGPACRAGVRLAATRRQLARRSLPRPLLLFKLLARTHRMRCPPPLGRQCRSCSHRCWCCLRCWMRRAGMTGRRNPSSRCWQGTLQSQRRGPTCRAGVKLAATRRQLAQRSCPSLTAPAVAAVWPAGAHAPHESYTTSWPPMSQLQSSLLVLPSLLDAPSGQDWQPSSMK